MTFSWVKSTSKFSTVCIKCFLYLSVYMYLCVHLYMSSVELYWNLLFSFRLSFLWKHKFSCVAIGHCYWSTNIPVSMWIITIMPTPWTPQDALFNVLKYHTKAVMSYRGMYFTVHCMHCICRYIKSSVYCFICVLYLRWNLLLFVGDRTSRYKWAFLHHGIECVDISI